MLKQPELAYAKIIDSLRNQYRLSITQVVFLPLGADPNSAAYKVVTEDNKSYFLKMRSGNFDETSAVVSKFLKDQEIVHVIVPIETKDHALWTNLENFHLILYPFAHGKDATKIPLSPEQWVDFGATLQKIHALEIPSNLRTKLQTETYSSQWRELVKSLLVRVEKESFSESVDGKLAKFLKLKRDEIAALVENAERIGRELQIKKLEFVLCHADLHAYNLLMATNDWYIIDWDNPILAPKERDLMFVGGGIGNIWKTKEERELFYSGYGPVEIDSGALAYYRLERIIQDIAVISEGIFSKKLEGEDRERNFEFLISNFIPNGVLEIAKQTH